jgi:ribose 1,5-bisphosphokinase PhnN
MATGRENIKIGVMRKITDRPSRTTEVTKKCVTENEFSQCLANGEIIASYTLESNGKRYGYHKEDINPEGDYDIVVADISVYQIPEMKAAIKDKLYVAGIIAKPICERVVQKLKKNCSNVSISATRMLP